MLALLTLMKRVGRGDTSDSKFLSLQRDKWSACVITMSYCFNIHFIMYSFYLMTTLCRVFLFSWCLCGFSPVSPVLSHSPKRRVWGQLEGLICPYVWMWVRIVLLLFLCGHLSKVSSCLYDSWIQQTPEEAGIDKRMDGLMHGWILPT